MHVEPNTKTTKVAKPTKQLAPRVIKPNPNSRLAKVTTKAKEAVAKELATKPKAKPTTDNDMGAIEAMKQSRRKLTMSSDALNLIRDGITRDKLKLHLMDRWGLTEAKKWYVNWYFAHAKRKGIKTCECDLAPKSKK